MVQSRGTHGVLLKNISPEIRAFILEQHPEFVGKQCIEFSELYTFRIQYIEHLIQMDAAKFDNLNQEVLAAIRNKSILVQKFAGSTRSIGQKSADVIAKFGGSWTFILCFFSVLFLWILSNSLAFWGRNFDRSVPDVMFTV